MHDFIRTVTIRWADVDPYSHLRHSAYIEYCNDMRIEWLTSIGFPPRRFQELGVGPVILWEQTSFYREVLLGERVQIELQVVGLSSDGAQWHFRQDIFKENRQQAAKHEIKGAWLDMRARKLTVPPQDLCESFSSIAHSPDFEVLVATIVEKRPALLGHERG